MTSTRLYGVWLSVHEFTEGHPPIATDPSQNMAIAGARDILNGRAMLLALNSQSDVFDDWRPKEFFSSHKSRKISDKSAAKYMEKRAKGREKLLSENPEQVHVIEGEMGDEPPEVPTEEAASPQQGQLVLTLSSDIVALLADTFALVKNGRAVTIVQQATDQG